MRNLKFTGSAHVREISAKDFATIGFEDADALKIDRRINPVAEVPDDIADWLLANEKGDWKEVNDEQAERARLKASDDRLDPVAANEKVANAGPSSGSAATATRGRGARSTGGGTAS